MNDQQTQGFVVIVRAQEHSPLLERLIEVEAREGFGVPYRLAFANLAAAFGGATPSFLATYDDRGCIQAFQSDTFQYGSGRTPLCHAAMRKHLKQIC